MDGRDAPTTPIPPRGSAGCREVLLTIDEAIGRTEQVIAKLELIKQGLLHDLLTWGIDENGELRHEGEAERTGDGVSRSLPPGWKPMTLGQVAEYVNGYPFKPEDWGEHGLPIVRIAQLTDANAPCDYYLGPLSARYLIRDGDLLFSWSATLMTLIWKRGPAWLNQHLFKVMPRAGTDLSFLHHLLDLNMNALAGRTHGTTMKHITRSDLLPFQVAVPPEEEQRRIGAVLDSHDAGLESEYRLLSKLRKLKEGLVEDLLTGRVRVTELLKGDAA